MRNRVWASYDNRIGNCVRSPCFDHDHTVTSTRICSLGSVRSHALPFPISRSLSLTLCLSHTLCLSSAHFHSIFACLARSNWRVNWQLVQLSSLSLIRAFAFAFAFNIIISHFTCFFSLCFIRHCNMATWQHCKHLHRVNEPQSDSR